MKTVKQIREMGFIIRPSQVAVNCTEVISKNPFRYFNKSLLTSGGVLANISEAIPCDEGYRLISAGLFADDEAFPWALITAEQQASLQAARANYQAAVDACEAAKVALDALLYELKT